MLKLAFITPTLKHGGGEKTISILSNALSSNFEIYTITFQKCVSPYSIDGTIIDLSLPAKNTFIGKLIVNVQRVIKLKKVIKSLNIDVIYPFLSPNSLINYMCLPKNVSRIISSRDYAILSKKNKLFNLAAKRSRAIIFNSQSAREYFIGIYHQHEHKSFTIYNMVNIEEVTLKSNDVIEDNVSEFYNNHTVIITSSRFVFEKGLDDLIKVFSLAKSKIKNLGLVLLGDGPLKSKIYNMCMSLGFLSDVLFLGFKDNPYKYIKNASVFVLTSRSEGFPNVLIEAMACHVPVISTDCKTGPRELLSNDYYSIKDNEFCLEFGIIGPVMSNQENFDINNINSAHYIFTNNLTNLILNDELRLKYSLQGFERAKMFSQTYIVNQLVTVITQLSKE